MGAERRHWLVFVRPPDVQFPIGLANLNHDVPRWGVTPKPVAAMLSGRRGVPLDARRYRRRHVDLRA